MRLGILNKRKPSREPEGIRQEIMDFLKLHPIHGKCGLPALTEHTDLQYDLGLDSMDVVELILHLEKKYNLNFNQIENIPNLKTIGGIAHFTSGVAAGLNP
jgi:acyl carrier protein